MRPIERAARAVAEYTGQRMPQQGDIVTCEGIVRVVLRALREPAPAIIAHVVQQVGDPTPEQWELGERACALNGVPSMNGDTACAELARDWQAMIDAALKEG